MYHSITFGDGTLNDKKEFIGVNTWDDWHLIPSQRPDMASPQPVTNFVNIPGSNVPIDMTTYLTGDVIYQMRSGSWSFYVDNDHENWITIRDKIMSFLHGQRMKCVMEDDPFFYYEGRFSLNEYKSQPSFSTITINYTVNPYRHPISSYWETQLWDPFNFDRDVVGEKTSSKGRL